MQFELGGKHRFHTQEYSTSSTERQEGNLMKNMESPSTHAPQKVGSFLPRLKDGGVLSRLRENEVIE
jgi:hypothetical protein